MFSKVVNSIENWKKNLIEKLSANGNGFGGAMASIETNYSVTSNSFHLIIGFATEVLLIKERYV